MLRSPPSQVETQIPSFDAHGSPSMQSDLHPHNSAVGELALGTLYTTVNHLHAFRTIYLLWSSSARYESSSITAEPFQVG